jgi:hypothetical protein
MSQVKDIEDMIQRVSETNKTWQIPIPITSIGNNQSTIL